MLDRMRALIAVVAVSILAASCAAPEKRAAEKERRTDEAQVGVITKIVDVVLEYKDAKPQVAGTPEDSKYKDGGVPGQRINVLLMNEQPIYVVQPTNPGLRVGDRVRIEDTPSGPRVVPQ